MSRTRGYSAIAIVATLGASASLMASNRASAGSRADCADAFEVWDTAMLLAKCGSIAKYDVPDDVIERMLGGMGGVTYSYNHDKCGELLREYRDLRDTCPERWFSGRFAAPAATSWHINCGAGTRDECVDHANRVYKVSKSLRKKAAWDKCKSSCTRVPDVGIQDCLGLQCAGPIAAADQQCAETCEECDAVEACKATYQAARDRLAEAQTGLNTDALFSQCESDYSSLCLVGLPWGKGHTPWIDALSRQPGGYFQPSLYSQGDDCGPMGTDGYRTVWSTEVAPATGHYSLDGTMSWVQDSPGGPARVAKTVDNQLRVCSGTAQLTRTDGVWRPESRSQGGRYDNIYSSARDGRVGVDDVMLASPAMIEKLDALSAVYRSLVSEDWTVAGIRVFVTRANNVEHKDVRVRLAEYDGRVYAVSVISVLDAIDSRYVMARALAAYPDAKVSDDQQSFSVQTAGAMMLYRVEPLLDDPYHDSGTIVVKAVWDAHAALDVADRILADDLSKTVDAACKERGLGGPEELRKYLMFVIDADVSSKEEAKLPVLEKNLGLLGLVSASGDPEYSRRRTEVTDWTLAIEARAARARAAAASAAAARASTGYRPAPPSPSTQTGTAYPSCAVECKSLWGCWLGCIDADQESVTWAAKFSNAPRKVVFATCAICTSRLPRFVACVVTKVFNT